MTFTVLLGNQPEEKPDVSTFSEIHPVKHIDDLLELLKLQDRYRHVYVSNAAPADVKKAATSRLHMHYKMSCPYTRKALYMIEKFQSPIVVAMHNSEHPDRRSKLKAYLQHTRGFDGSGRLTFPQFFYNGQPLGGTDTFAEHVDKIVENVSHDQADLEAAELVRVINGGWNAGALVAPPRVPYFDIAAGPFNAKTGVAGANYKSSEGTAKATSAQEYLKYYVQQRYPGFRAGRSAQDAVAKLVGLNAAPDTMNNNVPNWQGTVSGWMDAAVPLELRAFKFVMFKDTGGGNDVEYNGLNTVTLGDPAVELKTAPNGAILHKARLEAAKAYLDALIAGGAAGAAAAVTRAAREGAVSVTTNYFTALKDNALATRVGAAGVVGAITHADNYTDVRAAVQAAVGAAVGVAKNPSDNAYVVKAYISGVANPTQYDGGINQVRTKALIGGVYAFITDLANAMKGKSIKQIVETLYDGIPAVGSAFGGGNLTSAERYYTLAQGVYMTMLLYDATGPYVSFGRSRRKARKTSFGARKNSTRTKKTKGRRMNSFGKRKALKNKKKSVRTSKKSRKTRGRNA